MELPMGRHAKPLCLIVERVVRPDAAREMAEAFDGLVKCLAEMALANARTALAETSSVGDESGDADDAVDATTRNVGQGEPTGRTK
jgi:hypothetical protein